jgi:hypothetical protein
MITRVSLIGGRPPVDAGGYLPVYMPIVEVHAIAIDAEDVAPDFVGGADRTSLIRCDPWDL